MAGTITEIPTNGAADWTDSKTIEFEIIGKGMMKLSLTNMDDDSEPQIEAGSVIEMDGSFCRFNTIESITGWAGIANETDVYIKLTASGSSVSASFTTSAPSWSASKQGYYDGSDRYIGWLYKDASGNYERKYIYEGAEIYQSNMYKNASSVPLSDILIKETVITTSTTDEYEFELLKPISAWFYNEYTSAGHTDYDLTLRIYQDGDWRHIAGKYYGSAASDSIYNLQLNPGKYKVTVSQTGGTPQTQTVRLYCTGIYGYVGTDLDGIVKNL